MENEQQEKPRVRRDGIFNRGTKSDPKWYVKYKDVDGRWKM